MISHSPPFQLPFAPALHLSTLSLEFVQNFFVALRFGFHGHSGPGCFLSSRSASIFSPRVLLSTLPGQFWFSILKRLIFKVSVASLEEGEAGNCAQDIIMNLGSLFYDFWIWIQIWMHLLSWVCTYFTVNNEETLEGRAHLGDYHLFYSVLSVPE